MDQGYQQQPSPGPPSLPPQPGTYPIVQQPYYLPAPVAAPAARVSRAGVFGRIMRLLLGRLLYVSVRIGRGLWPYRVTIGLMLPLLAIIGVLSTALMWDQIAGTKPTFAR